MTCFVDTSALLAVMDKDDAIHKQAKAFWERLTGQQATLVTTNYVVLETVALLQHRIGVPAARRFHDDILPILTILARAHTARTSSWGAREMPSLLCLSPCAGYHRHPVRS